MANISSVNSGSAASLQTARSAPSGGAVEQQGVSGSSTTGQAAPSATDPLAAAVSQAFKAAATQQNGLAALFADVDALLALGNLPPDVRLAAQRLLSLPLSEGDLTADTIRAAVARSGLFLEAALAAGSVNKADLKSALLNLQQSLRAWLGENADASKLSAPPPPPHRNAPPIAQPPVAATISDLGLRDAGAKILASAEGALARHLMLQIVSLPETPRPPHRTQDQAQRLVFDLPLMTQQGTTIVQMHIERDGRRADADEEPSWRIGFSINVDPIGLVNARIAQVGDRTNVLLTAEKPSSAEALQGDLAALQAMLAGAALEPGELTCLAGSRPQPAAAPGLFLDCAS